MLIGNVSTLKVLRKTDIGYVLDSVDGEIFLHNNETNYKDLKAGDLVDVFLYFDFKGRVAATLSQPLITLNEQAFLTVKDINTDLGVFLEMGISKDLLLSKDDLPYDYKLWPAKGDQLFVSLKVKGRMVAKLVLKQENRLVPERKLVEKDHIEAIVYKIGAEGINLVSLEGHDIFVHKSLMNQTYRIGALLDCRIVYVSDKGYSGSLVEQKEKLINTDADRIYKYLQKYGSMPLDSDSTPEAIESTFKMSKKAFKRALGSLYKERKIVFKEGKTVLVE